MKDRYTHTLRWFAILAMVGVAYAIAGCGTRPPRPPQPPTPPAVRGVGTSVIDQMGNAINGADCHLQDVDGWKSAFSDANGYLLWPVVSAGLRATQVDCTAVGYLDFSEHRDLTTSANENLNPGVVMALAVKPLPPPPTREDILDLHITFQGLTVQCGAPYGTLPWFEASLAWLPPDCRHAAYTAKRASTAWPGGDSHALIFLPSGPALYDEPGQPYDARNFPPLDWTAGGTYIDGRLADLVAEVAREGFNKQLLFLGGDDGNNGGFAIAMNQLDLVYRALRVDSKYGDLSQYVVLLPGFDGVFYGYTPDEVAQWGAKCRALFVYCGIEHQPGRIPVGEGGGDYLPGGKMTTFDLILAEFNGPNDSAWRTHINGYDSQGRPDYNANQIWQIGRRMLGHAYTRPSDQPADADIYTGGGYLDPGSPRGEYRHCAFEWVGLYLWVRGQETADQIVADRNYFKSAGWTCGG